MSFVNYSRLQRGYRVCSSVRAAAEEAREDEEEKAEHRILENWCARNVLSFFFNSLLRKAVPEPIRNYCLYVLVPRLCGVEHHGLLSSVEKKETSLSSSFASRFSPRPFYIIPDQYDQRGRESRREKGSVVSTSHTHTTGSFIPSLLLSLSLSLFVTTRHIGLLSCAFTQTHNNSEYTAEIFSYFSIQLLQQQQQQ